MLLKAVHLIIEPSLKKPLRARRKDNAMQEGRAACTAPVGTALELVLVSTTE
jgi:hypothetical protein